MVSSFHRVPQKHSETHEESGDKDCDRPVVCFQLVCEIYAGRHVIEDLVSGDESHEADDQ